MRYWWSALYSLALIVYLSVLRRIGSTLLFGGIDGGDGYGPSDAIGVIVRLSFVKMLTLSAQDREDHA